MLFHDGSSLFEKAAEQLLAAPRSKDSLPLAIYSPEEFQALALIEGLTLKERFNVLDQANFLLENIFCHLPFKRARYAIDPLQQLLLLRRQLPELSASSFHSRMLHIFASLRDVHTNYFLPRPYDSAAAFLPFNLRYYYDASGMIRFEVSGVIPGFEHEFFRVGAELLSWSGLPLVDAIDATADIAVGANESARFLRGLQRLTLRPLIASLPPRESFVLLEYRGPQDAAEAESRGILLPWKIINNVGVLREDSGAFSSLALGPSLAKQANLRLFYYNYDDSESCYDPSAVGPTLDAYAPTASSPPPEFFPLMPEKMDFQFSDGFERSFSVPTSHLQLEEDPNFRVAYLRILNFGLPSDDTRFDAFDNFRAEFRRILKLANERSSGGLIIDIRGNPGGDIPLAESLLQYLTPYDIEPARFALLQTLFVQNLAVRISLGQVQMSGTHDWTPWVDDLTQAPFTGNPLTRGFPLSDVDSINDSGQIYQGPVVLLIDGTTYSAADFFAAGFQDNRVGTVLGVQSSPTAFDASSGGGGANRWSHSDLVNNIGKFPGVPLSPLPKDTRMGVSVRRSIRVGLNQGQSLEDLGVIADVTHQPTSADLHNFNFDLLQRACRLLKAKPSYHLSIKSPQRFPETPHLLHFVAVTSGIRRIEASLNTIGRSFPQKAFPIPGDGIHELTLEMDALPPLVTGLHLRGFCKNPDSPDELQLCTETKVSLV